MAAETAYHVPDKKEVDYRLQKPHYAGVGRINLAHPLVAGGKHVLGAVAFPDRDTVFSFGADCLKQVVVYVDTGGRALADGNASRNYPRPWPS